MAACAGRHSRRSATCPAPRHFDLYSQALSKIERGFATDLTDVAAMVRDGLVEPQRAKDLFEQIEPMLHRYPAIDPASFRAKVERALGGS